MEKLRFIFCFLIVFFATENIAAQSTVETIGDVALYASPMVVLGAAVFEKDREGVFMYAKGFAFNAATTLALKEIVGKERPNGEDNKSFPSGHTSATFQAAAYLQKRYGWNYGIPAYAIAGYTAYSRVYADKHYVEDVLAGATLGVLSSYLFTKKMLDKEKTTLLFSKSKNAYYVSFSYTF